MNDYSIILNYLRGNPGYCYKLGDYILPRYCDTIDLAKIRSAELLRRSKFVKSFESYLDKEMKTKQYLEKIPEFPIPIENRELWNTILKELGILDDETAKNVRYFKLDYLFPIYGICVEIDSRYHITKAMYDKARDLYLLAMYGIKTVRLMEFGKSKTNEQENAKIFINAIKLEEARWKRYSIKEPEKIILDFSHSIVENFITLHQSVFSLFTKSRKEMGDCFIVNKDFEVNIKDYIDDFPELNENRFKEDFKTVISQIYGKTVKFTTPGEG